MVTDRQRARWARCWDGSVDATDRSMRRLDEVLFRDCRAWVCGQAEGAVLEVGVGTGLNLPHYPFDVRLTGIDLSPAMIGVAQERAEALRREADLRVGDAEQLDLPDASVDTVVCTFSLCSIPDDRRAVDEMVRVLRPGGRLLLADHVASSVAVVRLVQRMTEWVSIPVGGEHFRRRPLDHVLAAGLQVERRERFALGLVERLVARRPGN
ncbi:class I SAM-dependent methyltransferase [Pseudonocardia sp. NPDC049154]|uniref:class I SAM-dependent methyltransferase n=1 Tax=Pseudonocardia sp. NPDC049154 TaxID=3155501 RepID=UPI003411D464